MNILKNEDDIYLRYKRVSKYENQSRIEQRIMYFIKNFELTEKNLMDELSRQFNITKQKALEEYERVKTKQPNFRKSPHKNIDEFIIDTEQIILL